jgi:hypothetical protein
MLPHTTLAAVLRSLKNAFVERRFGLATGGEVVVCDADADLPAIRSIITSRSNTVLPRAAARGLGFGAGEALH